MDYRIARTDAELYALIQDTAENCILKLVSEGGAVEHISKLYFDSNREVVLFDRVRSKGIHIYLEWEDNYAVLYEEPFIGVLVHE